jgi:HEAT repeat protein
MIASQWIVDLEHLRTSYLLLGTLAVGGVVAGVLFKLGVIGWLVRTVGRIVAIVVELGFQTWEVILGWASWEQFLGVAAALWVVTEVVGLGIPAARIAGGVALIVVGTSACFAYMFIDRERSEVERGYKSIHNVQKGQRPAEYLKRYGRQARIPLLLSASLAAIAGFAMLNQGLYETIGRRWYNVSETIGEPLYGDFLAFAVVLVMNLVDVLDLARTHHILGAQSVSAAAPPAKLIAAGFRGFFTLVLLHQVFASLRQGKALAETVADFWSPHEPIHERARSALPVFGVTAIDPLLRSLRSVETLTKEQRDRLPLVMETMGPTIIPSLARHLGDSHAHVREISAAVLGRLHALEELDRLLAHADDPNDQVRQAVVEALGRLGEHAATSARKASPARPIHRRRRWFSRRLTASRPIWPADSPIDAIVAALDAAMGDESEAVQMAAVEGLGTVGVAASATAAKLVTLSAAGDETFRRQVARALGAVGGEVEPTLAALMTMLEDPAAEVRCAAATALGALGADARPATPALAEALQDREEEVREAAAEAVARIGPIHEAAADSMAEGLTSPDTEVRAQTAQALGVIGEAAEEVVPALVAALDDESDRVRAEAVEAIGKIGEKAAGVAVPGLERALRDEDAAIVALAAEALGRMSYAAMRAVPALVKTIGHLNARARLRAAEALGAIGVPDASARAALERAAVDEDGGVRAAAITALGRLGDASRNRILLARAFLDEDPLPRAAAVMAAGLLEDADPASVDAMLPLLDDPNDRVKVEAARVLSLLAGSDERVVDGLRRQLLEDDSLEVQAAAALALGKTGPDAIAAGEALAQAARTGSAEVREQAMRALAMIRPAEAAVAFAAGLRDASEDVRILASAGLLNAQTVPDEVVPALVEALSDPEDRVRANAAGCLARRKSTPAEAVPALIECVSTANDALRLNAVRALEFAPADVVDEVMEQLTSDPSARVRLEAVRSLLGREAADPAAGAVLLDAMADPSPRVREEALQIFESLGDEGAAVVEAVRQAATDPAAAGATPDSP